MKKFKEIPSDIRNGLMAIIITFVGVAGLYSITFPWAGNDDSLPHIDYVWQVSQGHLPKFNEGTVYPFFGKFPYQYVSNHPPLYYMIQAPFMKLPLESGDWKVAVALGRGVNILLGIACILAFAWAGWVFNKGNHLATILLPGVAAFYITFLQVIGNIMNDSVMVLLSTLALTLSYLILRHGLTRKYAYSLAIISALGLLSRSTYIVPLFVSLLAVVISYSGLLERKLKINYRETLKGIGIATVIFIIALIPSSWFYARNFQQSGSFYKSSHGKNAITDQRRYKSLPEVITSPELYNAATVSPLGRMKQEHLNIPFTIVVVCLAIIGLTGKNRLKKQRFDKALIAMLALLAIHYMLIVGTQVDHAWGYGQYTARYILPALLPVALVTAFGFYATRRLLPYVVTGFILVTSMQALWQISDRLATRQPEIYGGMNWVEVIKLSIQNNGVPLVLAGLLLTVIASGIAAYFWSILSVNDSSKRRV